VAHPISYARYLGGEGSPVSTVTHENLDIAERAVEPEGSFLSTACLLFNMAVNDYQTHILAKNSRELVFV
jgi:hypothetical protein